MMMNTIPRPNEVRGGVKRFGIFTIVPIWMSTVANENDQANTLETFKRKDSSRPPEKNACRTAEESEVHPKKRGFVCIQYIYIGWWTTWNILFLIRYYICSYLIHFLTFLQVDALLFFSQLYSSAAISLFAFFPSSILAPLFTHQHPMRQPRIYGAH